MYRRFGKRALDILLSFAGLVALSPLFLALAVLVRAKLGKPAIFRQDRPGLGGRIFRLYKFRTMADKRDENGEPLPDAQRLTPFGKALRAASLDELPELWNILKGDMSLVGPRPLLVQYLPLYDKEQARRHDMRPGLTGHAQVNGRNAISWQEKFKLDCWYVDNAGFWLDVKILFRTAAKVFKKSGINSGTSETAEAFMGNGKNGENANDETDREYIIIGAGGHAAVIADILRKSGLSLKGFLDDCVPEGAEIMGAKVLGKVEKCKELDSFKFIIGIGDNLARKRIAQAYELDYGTAAHPSAAIGAQVRIGAGTVLMAGSIVNPRTSIGKHCIVNTGASLDHDNSLGDYVHVSPGAALGGAVTVGELSHIGLGASVKNNISICADATVGAGAAVIRDIGEPGVYVGVPAGKIRGTFASGGINE
jgi:sugar O-acyltransferase (sialic acid O-acetyltransferase NeuD family)